MGLPLYVAPVKSDLASRVPPKSATLRRQRRMEFMRNYRGYRAARAEAAARVARTTVGSPGDQPNPDQGSNAVELPPTSAPDQEEQVPSDTSSGQQIGDSRDDSPPPLVGEGWTEAAPEAASQLPEHSENFLRRYHATPHELAHALASRHYGSHWHISELSSLASARQVIEDILRDSSSDGVARGPSARVDGLGDRERSLSPEGDGVWDTLFSTLTPDPQPPSAGSSFASATVSGAASQNTGPSSRSSFTDPEMADELMGDHACESGCEFCEAERMLGSDWPVPSRSSASHPMQRRIAHPLASDEDGAERHRHRPRRRLPSDVPLYDTDNVSRRPEAIEFRERALRALRSPRPRGISRVFEARRMPGAGIGMDDGVDSGMVEYRPTSISMVDIPLSMGEEYRQVMANRRRRRRERLRDIRAGRNRGIGMDGAESDDYGAGLDDSTDRYTALLDHTDLIPFPTSLDPEYQDPARVRPDGSRGYTG